MIYFKFRANGTLAHVKPNQPLKARNKRMAMMIYLAIKTGIKWHIHLCYHVNMVIQPKNIFLFNKTISYPKASDTLPGRV